MATTVTPFRLERIYDCTQQRLWDAWTIPELYARWFNAAPRVDAVVHELDARPGGAIRFTMKGPKGEEYPNNGIFVSVDAPREFVTEEQVEGDVLQMHVRMQKADTGTLLTIEQRGLAEEFHDQARAGWQAILDKLEAVVER